jgi:hypothetical protein
MHARLALAEETKTKTRDSLPQPLQDALTHPRGAKNGDYKWFYVKGVHKHVLILWGRMDAPVQASKLPDSKPSSCCDTS